jgi:predicted ester cyclase
MPLRTPQELYGARMELWNGNHELADEIIAADCIVHQAPSDPDNPLHLKGPEGILQMIQMGHAPFSELQFRVEVGPLVDGYMLAARWTSDGRYKGDFPGAAVSPGTPINFGGIDIMRIENGKIAEYWVSSDGVYLMAQLGAL